MSVSSPLKRKADQADIAEIIGLVGRSQEIQAVLSKIRKIATSDSTVLITGESGTGKELIARAIHCFSKRSEGPMITLNCGAIPGELLESELFGHEKGSFTGAHKSRMGRFEMAGGGTIFLDEIGDMNPMLQVKLLRAIQEQTFERVGGEKPISVDIRIISATNKNLKKAVEDGSFREDLFYRLNVIPLHIPPLRERSGDIKILCEHFLDRFSHRMEEPVKKLSDKTLEYLEAYSWPGNVRELENLMERLSVMAENDTIDASDLPENIAHTPAGKTPALKSGDSFEFDDKEGFNDAVDNFQRHLIINALKKTGWVKAKAAELLKINRTTLVEKIKKLEIEAPSSESQDN